MWLILYCRARAKHERLLQFKPSSGSFKANQQAYLQTLSPPGNLFFSHFQDLSWLMSMMKIWTGLFHMAWSVTKENYCLPQTIGIDCRLLCLLLLGHWLVVQYKWNEWNTLVSICLVSQLWIEDTVQLVLWSRDDFLSNLRNETRSSCCRWCWSSIIMITRFWHRNV